MMEQARQLRGRMSSVPRQVVIAVAGVAVVTIIVMFFILRAATGTTWVAVSTEVKPDQIEAAKKALEDKDIQVRFTGNNSTIEVPKGSQTDAIGALAAQGISASHKLCNFEEQSLVAATGEQQKLKEKQCLENQIASQIESLDNVEKASVTVTMPTDRFLDEDSQVAEASVTVDTGTTELPSKEVAGIQNLVAASVPNLNVNAVTVLDVRGPMLSEVTGEDGEPLSDSSGALSEASLKRRLENQQKTQIELDLTAKFEKIVGINNVQVLANPEIDIDQIRREIKDVGGEDNVTGPAVREDLDVETLQGSKADAAGRAGTGSNVQNPQNAAVGTGVAATQRYGRDKGTTIYSNDEIREAVKVASGSVKQYRLSVICSDAIAKKSPSSCTAVQNAAEQYVGANETVAFNTASLAKPAVVTKAAKQAENMALILQFVKYFLLATGLGLMAFFIRRALNDRTYELLYPEDDMIELDEGLEPIPLKELEAAISAASTLDTQKRHEIQQKVDRIAAQKPNDVAQQLRGWLNDGSHR